MKCRNGSEANEESTERWYWVKATYKAVHLGVKRRRHVWDTTVFLIRGPLVHEPRIPVAVKSKAEEVAKRKERQYEAVGGHTVRWVFQQIDAMAPLRDDEIVEGTEVYWEFYQRVDKKPADTVAGKA